MEMERYLFPRIGVKISLFILENGCWAMFADHSETGRKE